MAPPRVKSSNEHKNVVIMSHGIIHEDFKAFRFHFQRLRTFEHYFTIKRKLFDSILLNEKGINLGVVSEEWDFPRGSDFDLS